MARLEKIVLTLIRPQVDLAIKMCRSKLLSRRPLRMWTTSACERHGSLMRSAELISKVSGHHGSLLASTSRRLSR
jgi:hypothetical protein